MPPRKKRKIVLSVSAPKGIGRMFLEEKHEIDWDALSPESIITTGNVLCHLLCNDTDCTTTATMLMSLYPEPNSHIKRLLQVKVHAMKRKYLKESKCFSHPSSMDRFKLSCEKVFERPSPTPSPISSQTLDHVHASATECIENHTGNTDDNANVSRECSSTPTKTRNLDLGSMVKVYRAEIADLQKKNSTLVREKKLLQKELNKRHKKNYQATIARRDKRIQTLYQELTPSRRESINLKRRMTYRESTHLRHLEQSRVENSTLKQQLADAEYRIIELEDDLQHLLSKSKNDNTPMKEGNYKSQYAVTNN